LRVFYGMSRSPWDRLRTAQRSQKVLAGVGAFLILSVIVYAADPHAGSKDHAPPTPAASAPATVGTPRPVAARKAAFPPKTLAAFRAFSATGDAGKVHLIRRASEGLPSCPKPTFYVTVSRRLTGRALEADLSAFFVQAGLINDHCEAFVFAFHSRRDYRAHLNNGFTAGRVALTTNPSGLRYNLELDAGSVSNIFNMARFDFHF
jgi:hypothetical protein